MCLLQSGIQAAQANGSWTGALPPAPAPPPTPVDQSVINNANAMKQRAAASAGYSGTIQTGGQGLITPAFTAGSQGYKSLTGQ